MRIDRNIPIPLYYQLQQQIKEQISNNELCMGDRLRSEEELMQESGLSRFTVRQALQGLEREGWIRRIRGKGTFISERRVPLSVAWQLFSFEEDMSRKGHRVETKVLSQGRQTASPGAAENLLLEDGESVFVLKRQRFLDGSPFLVDTIAVPLDIMKGLTGAGNEASAIEAALEAKYAELVVKLKRTLGIGVAKGSLSKLLGVRTGTSLFHLQEVGATQNDQPLLYAETFINETKSEFVFHLLRDVGRQDGHSIHSRDIGVSQGGGA